MADWFDQSEDGGGYRPAPMFGDIAQDPAFTFGSTFRADLGAAAPDPAAEGALFERRRIEVGLPPEASIECLAAASGALFLGLSTNHVIKRQFEQSEDLDLTKDKSLKIIRTARVFSDPSASHLLILVATMDNQWDTLYVAVAQGGMAKPAILKKFRGHEVTSVAWNISRRGGEERPTKEMLVGTSTGSVFEVDIDRGSDKYFKQVMRADSKKPEPITGLKLERLESRSRDPPDSRRFLAMITTPCFSYHYCGLVESTESVPALASLFVKGNLISLHQLPSDVASPSELVFHPVALPPQHFAWMTSAGVFCGSFNLEKRDGKLTSNERLIELDGGEAPVALALTEFHAVVLFKESFQAICLLNDHVVLTQNFMTKRVGVMRGVAVDPVMDGIFAYSAKFIFQIEAANETRDVWQLYLDKGQFEEAKRYAANNPAHLDKILTCEAEKEYSSGHFLRAAELFAKTQRSFEEVCLRFISDHHTDSLLQYLMKKLLSLSRRDQMQATMLCTWMVEIYLNAMNACKDEGNTEKYRELQAGFHKFLGMERVRDSIDKQTAYDLLASHGNVEDLVFFAKLIDDYERVIAHFLQQCNYVEAVNQLQKQPHVALFYRFAPMLMPHADHAMVDAFKAHPGVDPKFLIPALIRYQQTKPTVDDSNEAVRYLSWCVRARGNKDAAIHNYLLSLYAKMRTDEALLQYLEEFSESSPICFDQQYALRLCTQENKLRACVMIYSSMGLYEDAVDLALKVDVNLARQNANKPQQDPELVKKLWLRIARHVIEKEKDVQRAMLVLQDCRLLKIEDILPFFSDFSTIDLFQEDIIKSLGDYNREIDTLRQRMDGATASAQAIRQDIAELKNKFGLVAASDTCTICLCPLLTRAFYVFPCRHTFHSDCLAKEVYNYLSLAQQRKVQKIQTQLQEAQDTGAYGKIAQLKNDMDEIFTEDCVACGEILVRTIDEPFVPADRMDSFISTWFVHGSVPATL